MYVDTQSETAHCPLASARTQFEKLSWTIIVRNEIRSVLSSDIMLFYEPTWTYVRVKQDTINASLNPCYLNRCLLSYFYGTIVLRS